MLSENKDDLLMPGCLESLFAFKISFYFSRYNSSQYFPFRMKLWRTISLSFI